MSKRTIKNLVLLIIIVVAVVFLVSFQRARKAASLSQDLAQTDDYQAYRSMKKLAALGPGGADKAASMLGSKEGYVRARAASLMGQTHAVAYTLALERLLADPDPQVRIAATSALGDLRDRGAVGLLGHLFADETQPPEVRTAAGRSLALIGSPEAAPELVKVLQQPPTADNAVLRETAALALGTVHTSEAMAELAQHLQASLEPAAQVRALAAQGLALAAQAGPEATQQAGQALVAGLKDPASEVRIACAYSLSQMQFTSPLNQVVAEALTQAQNDPHYWVRQAATGAGQ